eukprot:CAMPEP_0194262502 /NCGR_PEP_ID=MMETSP0158-20130606/46578_1 /TAXON_ID=33649 /ORGANISM="Thalassionema nitzschioides, Strain L26-B" /LENGTH=313 /DNA_ID=CAMNT_0039002661 /DNA_START=28 /DNA_END=969 /DNA_ORIENTATION=-
MRERLIRGILALTPAAVPVCLTIAGVFSIMATSVCRFAMFTADVKSEVDFAIGAPEQEVVRLSKDIYIGLWGYARTFLVEEDGKVTDSIETCVPYSLEYRLGMIDGMIYSWAKRSTALAAAQVFSVVTPLFGIYATMCVCYIWPGGHSTKRLKCVRVLLMVVVVSQGLVLVLLGSEMCREQIYTYKPPVTNSTDFPILTEEVLAVTSTCQLDEGARYAVVALALYFLCAVLTFLASTQDELFWDKQEEEEGGVRSEEREVQSVNASAYEAETVKACNGKEEISQQSVSRSDDIESYDTEDNKPRAKKLYSGYF